MKICICNLYNKMFLKIENKPLSSKSKKEAVTIIIDEASKMRRTSHRFFKILTQLISSETVHLDMTAQHHH